MPVDRGLHKVRTLPLFAEIAFDLQARGKFVLFYQFIVLDLPLGKKE
jgi:hypothetical protein